MEGLVAPSKLYAALASGRPIAVICEQHSYLRTMVTDAHCGEAFNNGDAEALADFIRRLAADRQLAKQMGQAARHYLQSHFTPDLIAKQYSKLLSEAVPSKFEPSSSRKVRKVTNKSIAVRKEI
jgi:glycosyltransferase involved in cell wall biosynthesis